MLFRAVWCIVNKCCTADFWTSQRTMARGALIVFEGGDRSGKTTQCAKLVEAFKERNLAVDLMRFPERTTLMGSLINDYLTRKTEMTDQSIHLLFSANRWELVFQTTLSVKSGLHDEFVDYPGIKRPVIRKKLLEGTNVIIDRYAFSGVAFSAAKGLDLQWCKQPDVGLPKPDLVIFLDVNAQVAESRGEFGVERYENTSFQEKVLTNYAALKDETWVVIDAKQSVDEVHSQVLETTLSAVNQVRSSNSPISALWKD